MLLPPALFNWTSSVSYNKADRACRSGLPGSGARRPCAKNWLRFNAPHYPDNRRRSKGTLGSHCENVKTALHQPAPKALSILYLSWYRRGPRCHPEVASTYPPCRA